MILALLIAFVLSAITGIFVFGLLLALQIGTFLSALGWGIVTFVVLFIIFAILAVRISLDHNL